MQYIDSVILTPHTQVLATLMIDQHQPRLQIILFKNNNPRQNSLIKYETLY